MLDLREDNRLELKDLETGDTFIDEFGKKMIVTTKEYRSNGELVMSYDERE